MRCPSAGVCQTNHPHPACLRYPQPPTASGARLQNNTLSIENAPNATFYQSSLSLSSYNWFTINSSSVTLDNSRLNFSNYFTWWVGCGGRRLHCAVAGALRGATAGPGG